MKPAILVAIANDHDNKNRYLRELDSEAREIRKAFGPAAELCEFLPVRVDATFAEIRSVFREYRDRIAILHFAGHADGLSLFMRSDKDSAQGVRGSNLAEFLSTQNNLQLVFLNGCSTGPQCEYFTHAGVASVISTSQQVNDTVARNFAAEFYRSIARGASIQVAYREAAAASKPNNTDSPRGLYFKHKGSEERYAANSTFTEWPWRLRFAAGAEHAGDWNLPDASGNPLFGAPEIPKAIGMPPSPFKSLKRFEREDARIFFGRGFEIRDLYNKVVDPNGPPVILYYGQSGVGKSSLLDAGLKPRLSRRFRVRYQRRSEQGLTEGLRLAISSKLETDKIAGGWAIAEQKLFEKYERKVPLVVILDQVEECFTRPNSDPRELDHLVELIREIFVRAIRKPEGKLVLAFRKEWLAEISKKLMQHRVPFASVFLDRLGTRGVVEAVNLSRQVRDHFGLTIEQKLGEKIATDLLSDPKSPVAPTLQVLLGGMWQHVSESRADKAFSEQRYQQATREGLSLDDFVSRELVALAEHQPEVMQSGLGLDVLNFHITDLGTAQTRDEQELKAAYSHHWRGASRFVENCKDSYLLIDASSEDSLANGEPASHSKQFRLAHDTLGPLIRKRFDESDFPGQRARRIIDSRIQEWEDGKDGEPLDEHDLKTVKAGVAGMPSLNEDELRLVQASEDECKRKKSARRRLRVFSTIGMVTTTIVGLVAYLFWNNAQTNEQLRIAETRQKVSQQAADEIQTGVAERDQFSNTFKATHHFLVAENLMVEKQMDASLMEEADFAVSECARIASTLSLKATHLEHAFDMEMEVGVPDDRLNDPEAVASKEVPAAYGALNKSGDLLMAWTISSLLTKRPDDVYIWDLRTGLPRVFQLKCETLLDADINDAGTHFFTLSKRGVLSVYEIPAEEDGQPVLLFEKPETLEDVEGNWLGYQKARFRPDSSNLVAMGNPRRIDQQHIDSIRNGELDNAYDVDPVMTVDDIGFDSKGSVVATARMNDDPMKSVFMRDIFVEVGPEWARSEILRSGKTEYGIEAGAFKKSRLSPDGRLAVYPCANGPTHLVNVEFMMARVIPSGYRGESRFSLPSNRVLSWGYDFGSPVSLGQMQGDIGRHLPLTNIREAYFSSDARFVATRSREGGILWDAISGEAVTPALIHSREISDIVIDSQRQRVVTIGRGGTVRVWRFSDSEPVKAGDRIEPEEVTPRPEFLTRLQVMDLLPPLKDSTTVVSGNRSQSGDRMVVWDSEGAARVWDLETQAPVSQRMLHSTTVGEGFPLAVNGAMFALNDQVIITWTGMPILSADSATYVVNGEVRLWQAETGVPLSEKYWYRLPVEYLKFDSDDLQIEIEEAIHGGLGARQLRIRQLPMTGKRLANLVTYGELATGTRINEVGEFEFLNADEWQDLREKNPDYSRIFE